MYLMHIFTGSIDLYEGWESDLARMGEEEFGFSSVDEAIKAGILIEVVKDENGDWVEA